MSKKNLIQALIVVFLLTAQTVTAKTTKPSVKPAIKIAVSLALSGPSAHIGNGYLSGLVVAAKEINAAGGVGGRRIELVIEDNQNTGKGGVDAFRALMTKKPDLFLTTMSPASVAASPLAKETGIPLFASLVFADVLSTNENAVSFFVSPLDDGDATGKDMRRNNIRNVAILYLNTEYGKAAFDGFVAATKKYGIKIVASEAFLGNTNDFSGALLKLRQAEPDAYYIVSLNTIPIIKQLKVTGNVKPIYTSNASVTTNLMYQEPELFRGIHLVALTTAISGRPERTRLVKKMKTVFNNRNEKNNSFGLEAIAYDNLQAIASTLRKNSDPKTFTKTFQSLGVFRGITGDYVIGDRNVRMPVRPVVFNGKVLQEVK